MNQVKLDPVEQAVANVWRLHCDQLANRPLYLACSGGRDSLSLAFVLLRLYNAGQITALPTLLHINHQLQSCADDWARQVSAFACEHGFSCQVINVTPMKPDESHARQARYQALFEAMADDGVLLLAHHQDDQAETLLMRLILGAGLSGLSAMRVWQTRTHHLKTLALFRPYLDVPRADISWYAKEWQLPYVDDPTNDTDDNLRGKLRTHIMPHLRQLNPKVSQNIARTASILRANEQTLTRYIKGVLGDCLVQAFCFGHFQHVLDVSRLLAYPSDERLSLLYAFVKGDEPYAADYAFVQAVHDLCLRADGDHKTVLFWQAGRAGQGYVLCRYRGFLYRYSEALWQALAMPSAVSDKGVVLGGHLCGFVVKCLASPTMDLRPLDRQTSVEVFGKSLSGKKLYQTLGIPVWLRTHLYLVTWQDSGTKRCLVSVGQTWTIGDGALLLSLNAQN